MTEKEQNGGGVVGRTILFPIQVQHRLLIEDRSSIGTENG